MEVKSSVSFLWHQKEKKKHGLIRSFSKSFLGTACVLGTGIRGDRQRPALMQCPGNQVPSFHRCPWAVGGCVEAGGPIVPRIGSLESGGYVCCNPSSCPSPQTPPGIVHTPLRVQVGECRTIFWRSGSYDFYVYFTISNSCPLPLHPPF